MMFCCDGFQALMMSAGMRGISIIAWRQKKTGEIRFEIQSRGVDFADREKLPQGLEGIFVNLETSVCIHYCSGCGRKLSDLAKEFEDSYLEIASRHEDFRIKIFND